VKLLFVGIDLYIAELRLYIPFYITRESHEARFERINKMIEALSAKYEETFKEIKTKGTTKKKPAAKKAASKKPVTKKSAKKK
jgi:hypothetical protein